MYYPGNNQDPHKSSQPIRSSKQPIAAPRGSEINHGIHRNTRKRESESTSPFRVLAGGNSRPAGSFRGYPFVMIFLAWVIPYHSIAFTHRSSVPVLRVLPPSQ